MKWKKITVETTTQAVDLLSYYLDAYGLDGIEVEDRVPLSETDRKAMFIDILPELPPDDGMAYVSCYAQEEVDIEDLCSYIKEQMKDMSVYMDIGSGNITFSETEDREWIDNWKEFFHPFRLEENIVIQPTWTEEADIRQGDIVIRIDPGTAFGTGAHETTKLCIAALKKYIGTGGTKTVLDVGCGSGILSMIALKLGAKRVYGIDIDELAVKASLENLRLNGLDCGQYCIEKGDVIGNPDYVKHVEKTGPYDIVVANILADVIIPLSAVALPLMEEGTIFITSGIIDKKEPDVKRALVENGFEVLEVVSMGEWVSVVAVCHCGNVK